MPNDNGPDISAHALLGDTRSAALVDLDGSINWCVFDRFDANPVLAACLGTHRGGRWRITPVGDRTVARRYIGGSTVVETTFTTPTGMVTLVDAMVLTDLDHPDGGQLIRLVHGVRGEVDLEALFEPRFDFALTVPRMHRHDAQVRVFGGSDSLALETGGALEITGPGRLEGRFTLREGEYRFQVLTDLTPWEPTPPPLGYVRARRLIDETVAEWEQWCEPLELPEHYAGAVRRSAVVLKALTDGRTGAMVAAPTTSLPEAPSGGRTWDYRYTWLRDAAFGIRTLRQLNCHAESRRFFRWLEQTTAGRVTDLQILYGVGGERILPETKLCVLPGYEGVGPIRIGNGAAEQRQLDVYGHVLEAAWCYHEDGGEIDEGLWRFLCDLVSVVCERWEEPDRGIWEVRDHSRHFIHSKVMAWVALDRALQLGRELSQPVEEEWRRTAAAIRRRVLEQGVNRRGELIRAFGEDEPDAALLRVPLCGFLPADDPRVTATVTRIERELDCYPLVRRYETHDGLEGREAAFVLTGTWLVQVQVAQGRLAEATRRFEDILTLANDVGLFAEEVDPQTGRHWGNFPQAYSHVGIINAARALSEGPAEPCLTGSPSTDPEPEAIKS